MAEPLTLESRVVEASVFRLGAVVVRSATIPAGDWPREVAFDGLPLSLDDESLRASLRGPAGARLPRPSDLRVELVLPAIGESLVPAPAEELRQADEEVRRLEALINRVDHELARLSGFKLSLPEPFENRPPRPAPTRAWRGLIEWLELARPPRIEEKSQLDVALRRVRERRARLFRRDAELRAHRDAREDAVSKRVRVSLRDGGAPCAAELRLEYRVPGARWAPSYLFRVSRDGRSAELSLKALVAQRSGESWEGVRLSVSTADLLRETDLPELASLRIGRRQPPAPSRAWREPPGGSEALFAGLDQALALRPKDWKARPVPPPPPPRVPPPSPVAQGLAFGGAMVLASMDLPAPSAMARPNAAPRASSAVASRKKGRGDADGGALGRSAPEPAAFQEDTESESTYPESAPPPELAKGSMEEGAAAESDLPEPTGPLAASSEQLRFAGQVLAGWGDEARRGRLRPLRVADYLPGADDEAERRLLRRIETARGAAEEVRDARLPEGARDAAALAGAFDHRWTAEGPVDVPSDGSFHAVPLLGRTAPVETRLVVVPRESDEAVRLAVMKNPLEAPLLAGPADVYVEDEFLVCAPIRTVPAGGLLHLGLGVEEGLKVARNAHFAEEAVGLMGGAAALRHSVEIDLASRLRTAVQVEVRERVPTKDDPDDQEVEIGEIVADPPWEEWRQEETHLIKGGRRWLLTLEPGESRKLTFRYAVRIDAKHELLGGNRRE